MACYRYVTPAIKGRWHFSREEALAAALEAGQAFVAEGEIILFPFADLEAQDEQHCVSECAEAASLHSKGLRQASSGGRRF